MSTKENFWMAETLRISAFLAPNENFDIGGWWTNIIGEPPETDNSRPRDGVRQIEGQHGSGRLTLISTLGRVDLLMKATDNDERENLGIPNIGRFEDAMSELTKLASKFISTLPPVKRMAFGAVLVRETDSHESGYKILGEYLKSVQIDSTGSSDFIYQINRPRKSNAVAGDLGINRLSKWSVLRVRKLRVEVPQNDLAMHEVHRERETYGCRLELDVNTKPDLSGFILGDRLFALYEELVSLAREISLSGDIP